MAPEAPSDRHELCDAIYGLATLVIRRTPRPLSLTAAATLASLEREGPQRLTALADAQRVAQPSMTSLVTRLEAEGLVTRGPDPDDGRVVLVALAPGGADHLAERRRRNAASVAGLLDALPPDEAASLAAALPAMIRLRDLDAAGLLAGAGESVRA